MKKWNKIPAIVICLSLLFPCSACTAKTETSEYTESTGGDPSALAEYGDSVEEILLGCGTEDRPPKFVLQNAEGQILTLEGLKATGNMKLLSASRFGFSINYAFRYKIPRSARYIITPDTEQEPLLCLIYDYFESADMSRQISWFLFSAKGAEFVDHSPIKTIFSGHDMEYGLIVDSLKINPDASAIVSFDFLGEKENCLTIKYDSNTFLFKGERAESQVRMHGLDGDKNDVDVILGVCPAGKWTRLSYNGTEWILTEEPPSPWPWIALGGGILLAAAVSFLLYRRRKATLPAFSEDPEHDTADHPPEEP